MKRIAWRLGLLAAVALFAAWGCAEKPLPPMAKPEGTLAVAGFSHPKFSWELLAGYLPEEGLNLSNEVVRSLDQVLTETLQAHGVRGYTPPGVTRQCQEIVVFEQTGCTRESAWKYWLSVGKCLPADFLLVPQVLFWREREGGSAGVEEPASVVLDIYLIDVKAETVAGRYHYDETQQPLSENLLEAGKFFRRKGRWVPALELAREGLDQGLRALGL
ncbi:MAG: hypothetical protein JW718_01930 [Desulfovibrionaceae bacterium]|nr:hypothetical protein [Desulfovibrionaceae bacterium]